MTNRNHLPESFYYNPRHATTTLTKNQLKKTLNATGGTILSCGSKWKIKSEELDRKTIKVWLEEVKSGFW